MPHSSIIRKDQRVVQNYRRGMAFFDKHLCKSQTNKNSDLLLRSHTQVFERLFMTILPNDINDMEVLINSDLSVGKQQLQVATDSL